MSEILSEIPAAAAPSRRPALPAWAGQAGYPGLTIAMIVTVTIARLIWLGVQPADLYPDEAQYWFWAQTPALGYYSKPPLIAWVIAATTAMFGDSEFAIRVSAPLLHATVAAFVYLIAARIYDRRIGFWAAFAYASLPGVSMSAFLVSTDAVLLPCWAAALYAFIRAREPDGGRWWIAVGIAAGLGLLAKYAMAYWLLSALLFVLCFRSERRHLKGLARAAFLAFLVYLPNLWWNRSHGFVSYLHVRDNAHLPTAGVTAPSIHPLMLLEFFGSQFGVFGPVFFALLIAIVAKWKPLSEPRARLLAIFALPILAMMLTVSLLSRAQPNWAAPTYISAIVLVTAWALQQGWRRLVAGSIALNFVLAVAVFGAAPTLAAAGIAIPAKYDPLHRLRGWRELGQGVGAVSKAHPGLTLLADDRELLAALIYYVRPHPFDAVNWSMIPGIKNQWGISNNLDNHVGEDFLAVTQHGLVNQMRRLFDELTPLTTITTATGPGGGRTYTLYIARGYRGEPPQ